MDIILKGYFIQYGYYIKRLFYTIWILYKEIILNNMDIILKGYFIQYGYYIKGCRLKYIVFNFLQKISTQIFLT